MRLFSECLRLNNITYRLIRRKARYYLIGIPINAHEYREEEQNLFPCIT